MWDLFKILAFLTVWARSFSGKSEGRAASREGQTHLIKCLSAMAGEHCAKKETSDICKMELCHIPVSFEVTFSQLLQHQEENRKEGIVSNVLSKVQPVAVSNMKGKFHAAEVP